MDNDQTNQKPNKSDDVNERLKKAGVQISDKDTTSALTGDVVLTDPADGSEKNDDDLPIGETSIPPLGDEDPRLRRDLQ